jgi:hypothetical protein
MLKRNILKGPFAAHDRIVTGYGIKWDKNMIEYKQNNSYPIICLTHT